MKRISLILIILFLIVFGVSAAAVDTKSLYLSTEVEGFALLRVGDHTKSLPESWTEFTSLSSVGTSDDPLIFNSNQSGGLDQHFAIFVAINEPGDYVVTTTPKALKNSNGYIMPYTVQRVGDASAVTVNSDSGGTFTLIEEFEVSGLTLKRSANVDLVISQSVLDAAEAGSYSSVWTINLIKN